VEAYDPWPTREWSAGADADGPKRRRLGYGRPQDLCGGRRGDHRAASRRFRGWRRMIRQSNTWITLPSMPMPRHGVAGAVINNELHLVSGMVQSAGSMAFLDPKLVTTPRSTMCCNSTSSMRVPSASATAATSEAQASSRAPKKVYIRYNINSPQGQVMLAKYVGRSRSCGRLPDYDTHSWTWWWYTHWVKGRRRSCGTSPGKGKRKSSRHSRQISGTSPRRCGTAARRIQSIPPTLSIIKQWYFLPWHRLMLHEFEGGHSRGAAR
jgi:hypothetical protein